MPDNNNIYWYIQKITIPLTSVGLAHAHPQLLLVSDRNTRERISDESLQVSDRNTREKISDESVIEIQGKKSVMNQYRLVIEIHGKE